MIVVDSSVWIDWFRDEDVPAVRFLDSAIEDTDAIIIGDLVLVGILQGARHDLHAAKMERFLRRFRYVALCDPNLTIKAASNFRRLRSLGVTIRKTPGLIIATYCIENDHERLQSDRDFKPFQRYLGLKLTGPGA